MPGDDPPAIAALRPDSSVSKVAREVCILITPREARAQGDYDDVVRDDQELQVVRFVHSEQHEAPAMQCEIVTLCRQFAIGSGEQQRIVNQSI